MLVQTMAWMQVTMCVSSLVVSAVYPMVMLITAATPIAGHAVLVKATVMVMASVRQD
jgi:hypothetical protein